MKNMFKIKFAIYALSFILLATNAISPAMKSISSAFPEVSAVGIQLVLQLPMLMSVPFIIFGGIVARKFDKKKLILLGLALFVVGGTGGFYTNSYAFLVISRCLYGIGYGLLVPCSMGLVSDLFYRTSEYASMIGYENAVKNIGGVCFTALAGFLCLRSWHHVFLLYFTGAVVFAIMLLFMPDVKPREDAPDERPAEKAAGAKEKLPRILIPAITLAFFVSFCQTITNGNLSYLIEDGQFGNASLSGMLISLATCANVAGSTVFSRTERRFSTKTVVIGVGLNLIGLWLLGSAKSLAVVVAGVIFAGFGQGYNNPALLMLVGKESRRSSTLYFSIVQASMNLGAMLQAILVPTITKSVFGGAGVGKYAYLVGACVELLTVIGGIAIVSRSSRRAHAG